MTCSISYSAIRFVPHMAQDPRENTNSSKMAVRTMTDTRLVVSVVGSFNNISAIPLEHHAGLVAGKDGGKALVL